MSPNAWNVFSMYVYPLYSTGRFSLPPSHQATSIWMSIPVDPQGIDMRITVPALKEFTLTRDQARRRSVCAHSTAVSWNEQRRVHEDGTHSASGVRFGGGEGEERWEGTEAWRTSPVWLAREYSWEVVCKAKLLISQKKQFLILVGKAGLWGEGTPKGFVQRTKLEPC